jgi:hypothetical protein
MISGRCFSNLGWDAVLSYFHYMDVISQTSQYAPMTLKHVFTVSTSPMWRIATYWMLQFHFILLLQTKKQSKIRIKHEYQIFHNINYVAKYADILTKMSFLFNSNFLRHGRLHVLQNAQCFLHIALAWCHHDIDNSALTGLKGSNISSQPFFNWLGIYFIYFTTTKSFQNIGLSSCFSLFIHSFGAFVCTNCLI